MTTAVYPNLLVRIKSWVGIATDADNAIIFTSPTVARFNYFSFGASGVEDIRIEITLNGDDWIPASVLLVDDNTTNTRNKAIPADDIGVLDIRILRFRVLQDGASTANAYGFYSLS